MKATAFAMFDRITLPLRHESGRYRIAVKFAPDGRIVDLRIEADGVAASIDVELCGAAIDAALLPRQNIEGRMAGKPDQLRWELVPHSEAPKKVIALARHTPTRSA